MRAPAPAINAEPGRHARHSPPWRQVARRPLTAAVLLGGVLTIAITVVGLLLVLAGRPGHPPGTASAAPGGLTPLGTPAPLPKPATLTVPLPVALHIDSRLGPGVFYRLRELHPGNRIYVRQADGRLAVFRVTAVHQYPKAHFPTAAVYGPVPDAELHLITCGGTFDYATHSYLSNIVVDSTEVR
jgi:hypothetical protein